MPTIGFTLLWNVGLATLLAILVGLLSRSKMLQRRPGLTHTLWLLVLAKLVTPPVIPVPVLPSLDKAMANARTEVNTAYVNNGRRLPSPAEHGALVVPQPAASNAWAVTPTWSIPWLAILLGVSGCGTLILVTGSLAQLVRVSRTLRRATSHDLRLQRLARAAAARMATQETPVVRVVDVSLAPFLWVRRCGPVIVLPKGLIERMDDAQITCILAHELAHYARRDHWSNAFSFLVAALFWWQPVVWWARREMRAAQEVCCDGMALATGAATRRCYAETLFQALEFVQTNRPLQPTLVSGFGSSCSLKRRFEMIASHKVNHRLSCWTASFAVICTVSMLCVPTQVKSQNGVAQRDAETNRPGAAAKVEAGADQSADIAGRSPPIAAQDAAFVRAYPEGRLNRKLISLTEHLTGVADYEPTSDKDPMRSVRVVERATLTFDALEATVDPAKHCIFVGDTKRNVRTGALRVDLKRGAAYTVKATGEAFMTSETGGDADPFPGLLLFYPTDEEDCYAMKMAVVKPGDAVTFQTPWAISPKDEVYALAFFLAVVPGEHRGSYKLAITKTQDPTDGPQIWEETIKQLDEDAARADVELQRHLQKLDRQRSTTGTRNAAEEFRKTFPDAEGKVNPVTGRVGVPTQD